MDPCNIPYGIHIYIHIYIYPYKDPYVYSLPYHPPLTPVRLALRVQVPNNQVLRILVPGIVVEVLGWYILGTWSLRIVALCVCMLFMQPGKQRQPQVGY